MPGLWRLLPPSPLTPRVGHALVATGRQLMVWGGADALGRPLTDGAVFDLATGRWRRLPDPPVPLQPGDLLLADADRLLVGAPGRAGRPGAVAGLRLDAGVSGWSEAASGSWVRIDAGPFRPSRLVDVIATGDGALVWDRIDGRGALRRWASDRWTRVLPTPLQTSAPRPAAWTGSGVAVWGGFDGGGGVFTPR